MGMEWGLVKMRLRSMGHSEEATSGCSGASLPHWRVLKLRNQVEMS